MSRSTLDIDFQRNHLRTSVNPRWRPTYQYNKGLSLSVYVYVCFFGVGVQTSGSIVTKPGKIVEGYMRRELAGSKVTSQNRKWRHRTKMAATPSPADSQLALRDRGNCPIAAKFGTDLEFHIAENTGEPEVTSQNRKWTLGTGSEALGDRAIVRLSRNLGQAFSET